MLQRVVIAVAHFDLQFLAILIRVVAVVVLSFLLQLGVARASLLLCNATVLVVVALHALPVFVID